MSISEAVNKDRQIVRDLAKRGAEIAALPVQKEKREMWRRLNDLHPVRPMVLIFGGGISWSEMRDESLNERAVDPYYRAHEQYWRRLLFRWEHIRGDMVVEPFMDCGHFINDTGCGFPGWGDESLAGKIYYTNDITSRSFKPMIHSERDLEKFHLPIISVMEKETNEYFEKTRDLYDGIIDVRLRGIMAGGFSPWNDIVAWLGVEESLTALAENPDLVHKIMRYVVDAQLSRLEQYEQLNLLSLASGNQNTGNGGYAYTNDLPSHDSEREHVKLSDLWSFTAAEIFSCVSPEMHDEFSLQYELEILKKYGLTYYGCCEPLDNKMHLMRKIPNLRKISMCAWTEPERAASQIGSQYVYSYKPDNTAISSYSWDAEETRRTLRKVVDITKRYGCPVEIIMNAVSTVCGKPERIFEWAKIAQEVAESV